MHIGRDHHRVVFIGAGLSRLPFFRKVVAAFRPVEINAAYAFLKRISRTGGT